MWRHTGNLTQVELQEWMPGTGSLESFHSTTLDVVK